jgi:hypothetical protein
LAAHGLGRVVPDSTRRPRVLRDQATVVCSSVRFSVGIIEIFELEIVCWHRSCKNIFGERTPCKKLAYLQKNTLKEQFFRGLRNLSSLYKIGPRPTEKTYPFLKHASSIVAPRISMHVRSESGEKKMLSTYFSPPTSVPILYQYRVGVSTPLLFGPMPSFLYDNANN